MLSLYYLLDTPLGDDVAMDKAKKSLCFYIFQRGEYRNKLI